MKQCLKISQDCIGVDRNWSLVFADHRPAGRRVVDIDRLLTRTELIVTHDTEMVFSPSDQQFYNWPALFQNMTKDVAHATWRQSR